MEPPSGVTQTEIRMVIHLGLPSERRLADSSRGLPMVQNLESSSVVPPKVRCLAKTLGRSPLGFHSGLG